MSRGASSGVCCVLTGDRLFNKALHQHEAVENSIAFRVRGSFDAGLSQLALEQYSLPADADSLPPSAVDVVAWAGLRHVQLDRSAFIRRWQRYTAALQKHVAAAENEAAADAFLLEAHSLARKLLHGYDELDVLVGASEHADGPLIVLHYLDDDPLTPQLLFLCAGCKDAPMPDQPIAAQAAEVEASPLEASPLETPFTFTTPLGDVSARIFGTPRGTNFVLCVQGKSPNVDVVTEWQATARALASNGWCVLLPDLHTNPKTKPGVISAEDVANVLLAALKHHSVDAPIVLLGKSWGGGQATRFAASSSAQQVSKLVLVAPSLDDPKMAAQLAMPVLLFWAEDDTVVPMERAAAYTDGIDAKRLTFTKVASGGHRVLDEYIPSIVRFLGRE